MQTKNRTAGKSEIYDTCYYEDIRIPNLFVLGATKSGTTSIYKYLSMHPKIFTSSVKEPQFFSHDNLFSKGLGHYLDVFYRNSENYPIRVDATPHYLYFEKVAKRLASLPHKNDLKFIVIMRDPVKRAYSMYWNMVSEGVEKLSFEDALLNEQKRSSASNLEMVGSICCQYTDSGMYAKQINTYLKYFNISQFLFLFFEELKNDSPGVLRQIWEFLDIDPIQNDISKTIHNSAGIPRNKALHKFLRQPNWIKNQVGRILPQELKYRISQGLLEINKKPKRYPYMKSDIERELRTVFRSDIKELEKITGRKLTNWLLEVQ